MVARAARLSLAVGVVAAVGLVACNQLFSIDEGQQVATSGDGGGDVTVAEGGGEGGGGGDGGGGGEGGADGGTGAETGGDAGTSEGGCGPTCIVDLAANGTHTCGVTGDHSVYCWGNDLLGQSGPGAPGGTTPFQVPGFGPGNPAHFVKVSDGTSCAVLTSGALWCWGANALGTVGVPDAGNDPDGGVPPVEVLPAGKVSELTMGAAHACVLTTDTPAQVLCWGANGSGQAGQVDAGIVITSPTPVAVTDVTQLVAAANTTCFVRSSSPPVECIGDNSAGELGLGSAAADGGIDGLPHPVPTAVTNVATFGNPLHVYHSCGNHIGLTFSTSEIAMWGDDTQGQLGPQVDAGGPDPDPSLVSAISQVTQLAMTQFSTCALRIDGTVWCWGSTNDGECGSAASAGAVQSQPVQIVGLPEAGVTELTTGTAHACAVSQGQAWCWGLNGLGQLGRNTNKNFDPVPAPVVIP